ncbi:hypothetical protein PULV_a4110 [Pseudoalteromonas ulvae UL12]|uniref:Catalase n=1 Tax=Pseudoalteromonas ulvae TaxID=107327 RepID=A0A244CWW6_PSEDV|nr:putative metalloprotease CJM1_0395 family protein [Pseudoalteromonas ulvae]MBE0364806.1 hypothetical protein [Pseudoalteromonas ulvae UL12]OUL59739.1 catalase [Pseudoalteromonas ulvae]
MNIVTSYPTINLNTANVQTEVAKKDNQNRELIPQAKELTAISPEARLVADTEKAKTPGLSVASNQESLTPDKNESKTINGKQEQSSDQGEQSSEQDKEEQQQQAKQQVQQELEQKELEQIKQLKSRDLEVRAHEQAHAAVGGSYAGSPSYEYEKGPDGNRYAVAGEVPIDVSEVPNDPQATIEKMQQVQAAALAPAEPSSQDRKVAALAAQTLSKATSELLQEQNKAEESEKSTEETSESDPEASANIKDDSQSSSASQVNNSSESVSFSAVLAQEKIQRDPAIEQRAERIANHYLSATAPQQASQFARQI